MNLFYILFLIIIYNVHIIKSNDPFVSCTPNQLLYDTDNRKLLDLYKKGRELCLLEDWRSGYYSIAFSSLSCASSMTCIPSILSFLFRKFELTGKENNEISKNTYIKQYFPYPILNTSNFLIYMTSLHILEIPYISFSPSKVIGPYSFQYNGNFENLHMEMEIKIYEKVKNNNNNNAFTHQPGIFIRLFLWILKMITKRFTTTEISQNQVKLLAKKKFNVQITKVLVQLELLAKVYKIGPSYLKNIVKIFSFLPKATAHYFFGSLDSFFFSSFDDLAVKNIQLNFDTTDVNMICNDTDDTTNNNFLFHLTIHITKLLTKHFRRFKAYFIHKMEMLVIRKANKILQGKNGGPFPKRC